MERIPDNYDLWVQHEEDRERVRERCPVCAYCGEKIMDAYAFYINFEWFHEDCYKEEYFMEVV